MPPSMDDVVERRSRTMADGTTVTETKTTRTTRTETVEETPMETTVTRRRVIDDVRRPRAMGPTPVPAPAPMRAMEPNEGGALARRVGEAPPSTRALTPLKKYSDLNAREKVEINEKRLFETQATLVRETMKREVTENVLQETAKSLSAVRKAAMQGQTVTQTGGAIPGSVEHQNTMLVTRVKELTQKMQELHAQHQEKESELQSLRRLLQQRETEFDLIGERPVSINLEVKEVDDEGQMELIEQTRSVLKQAEQQVEAVAKLRQVDRQRTRALGDLVLTMESRRQELQGKLKEAGILEEYDDDRVKSAAAGYGHMMHNVEYERPVTSASGKTFYVTRTATFWDRFFGIHV